MGARYSIYADWNPWHGCTKISPGCKYCYVYRQDEMYGSATQSSLCRKTGAFDLPIRKSGTGAIKSPREKSSLPALPLTFCSRTQTPGGRNAGR